MRARPRAFLADAFLLWTTTCFAANFLVDSTLDDVDALSGDGDCLTVDSKCTLAVGPDVIVQVQRADASQF